ncbi:MAG: hypothetical protein IKN09_01350 [Clostridia bacterium]|nr:hypothetical protein [Clostridia bacterium]
MSKQIIILIVELLIIGGGLVFYKKTANSIRIYFRNLRECDNNELTKLMEEFIKFFDRFEKYVDREMSTTEFLTELKSKGIINNEEPIEIPLGTDSFRIPVYDTMELRCALLCAGELIYEKADLMKELHNTKIEQLDVYEKFSKKFLQLKYICTKHSRKK